jgi:sarcosine oxidase subunit gamma
VFEAPVPDLNGQAAITDQTDAWAVVRISGAGVEDVLARLVPIDLCAKTFRKGHTARTLIGHMTGSVTRLGPNSFEIMVMRSMASTLVHELETAAKGFAERGS